MQRQVQHVGDQRTEHEDRVQHRRRRYLELVHTRGRSRQRQNSHQPQYSEHWLDVLIDNIVGDYGLYKIISLWSYSIRRNRFHWRSNRRNIQENDLVFRPLIHLNRKAIRYGYGRRE